MTWGPAAFRTVGEPGPTAGQAATQAVAPLHRRGVPTGLTGTRRPPRAVPSTTPPAVEGIAVAIAAVTGVEDLVGDVIVPGAFKATLAKRRPKIVTDHTWSEDVGRVLHIEELLPGDRRLPKRTNDGAPWPTEAGALLVTMQFNMDVERARDAWSMMKFYADSNEAALSIGYKVVPGLATKRGGVRYIYGLDLWEISTVLHGAHPLTMALEVKQSADDLEHKETAGQVLSVKGAEPSIGRGVMVALYPPAAVQQQLAVLGGSPAEELHITLAYLGDASDLSEGAVDEIADALTDSLSRAGALTGTVGGLGVFPPGPDGAPTFVPVDVPGLVELRQTVVDTLAAVGHPQVSEHGFTPHLTLGYDLSAVSPVESTPVSFDDAVLVVGDARRQLPLTAPIPAPDAPVDVEAQTPVRAPLEAKSALDVLTAALPPVVARAGWSWKSAGDVALAARFGDPFGLLEEKSGVPGVADTPSDHQAVAQLRRAWTHGSVAAQIGWNTPGDFTRCTVIAEKYMSPEHAKGWCANRHKESTGVWPGDRRNVGHEAKTANPDELETKMAQMAGSMQERLAMIGDAVRQVLGGDGDGCYVSVDATYPDHVIATRMKGEGDENSFSVPYTLSGDTVSVEEPQPVTLSVVASPVGDGTGEELTLAAATEARFLTPAVGQLEELSALVTMAPLESKAMRTLRPAVQDFLDALAVKGMDVPGLLLGDDEDDENDENDEKPAGKGKLGDRKPWEKKGDPDDELPGDDAEDDDAVDVDVDDEDLEEKGFVRIDLAEIAADLATLRGDA